MTVSDPIRTVIWGQPGVGKTTLAATFPNPWFIDIEKSTAWMPELRKRQYPTRPKTWADIIAQIREFKRAPMGDTLVIDSIDWLEAKYIAAHGPLGGQNDYGKSYNELDKNFRDLLDELTEISEMGIHIVLTAHFDVKDQNDPDQMAAYSKYVLKMQKKTCSAVLEWADQVLFIRFRDVVIGADKNGKKGKATGGTIRDIKTVRAASYDAKNRFDLPEELEFKADKQLPEPLRTLIWNGFDAYLALKNGGAAPVQQISQPMPQPDPAPQPKVQINPDPQPSIRPQSFEPADPQINPALKALMDRDHIEAAQIEAIVAAKRFLPGIQSIYDYPEKFVVEMLIGGWEQMKVAIQAQANTGDDLTIDDDELPF